MSKKPTGFVILETIGDADGRQFVEHIRQEVRKEVFDVINTRMRNIKTIEEYKLADEHVNTEGEIRLKELDKIREEVKK